MGGEVLSEWFSLDGQLVRSLRQLIWPGRLSALHVEGKRAPYLTPVRLYFVASVALFSTVLTLEAPDASSFTVYVGGERVGPEPTGEVKRQLDLLKGDGWIGYAMRAAAGDRVERARELPPQEVVDGVFDGFRRVLPSALILFVPFLALGLKLLYIRRKTPRYLYLDHLVFALHYQSALFFALLLTWLGVVIVGSGDLIVSLLSYVAAGLVMILVYLPLALRRFYQQSRFWTGIKACAVLWIYGQLLGIVLNVSALYGL